MKELTLRFVNEITPNFVKLEMVINSCLGAPPFLLTR